MFPAKPIHTLLSVRIDNGVSPPLADGRSGSGQLEEQVRQREGYGEGDHDEAPQRAQGAEGGRSHILLTPSHVCHKVSLADRDNASQENKLLLCSVCIDLHIVIIQKYKEVFNQCNT